MKQYFMALIISYIAVLDSAAYAQSPVNINQIFRDSAGNEILVGKCTIGSLSEAPFSSWFRQNYDTYLVDTATCKFLSPLLKDKKITIFMGTWCGDSKRQVPAMLKMLDCCNFPKENITLIMVSNQADAYKMSPQHEEKGKNIQRVPTLIIDDKKAEIGRIIEFPVVSLEKDMLRILRKEQYLPNYSNLQSLAVNR